MTPEKLQEDLIDELKKMFSNIEFTDENGKKDVMNFFKQSLPRKKSDEEPDPFPWCVVALRENKVNDVGDLNQIQDVELYFGIYYDNPDCQYQHTMLSMFEKVKKRFLTNPILGEFSALPDIVSILDNSDAETYPFYFAGMALKFYMPNYEREDDFS